MAGRHILDWEKIRAEFMSDKKVALVDLAKKYRCAEQTVKVRSQRERWFATRDQLFKDATARAEARLVDDHASRLQDWNDKDHSAAKTARGLLLKKLNRLIKISNEEDAESTTEITKVLQGLESAQRIGRLALGASTSNEGLVPNPDADGIGQPRLGDFYQTVQFEGPDRPVEHESASDASDPKKSDPETKH